jgi:hypothetical protein
MRRPAFSRDGFYYYRVYCTMKLVVAFPEMPPIVPAAFAWYVPTGSCFFNRSLYTAVPLEPVVAFPVTIEPFVFVIVNVTATLASVAPPELIMALTVTYWGWGSEDRCTHVCPTK